MESLIALSILVSAVHALRPLVPGGEALIALGFGLGGARRAPDRGAAAFAMLSGAAYHLPASPIGRTPVPAGE